MTTPDSENNTSRRANHPPGYTPDLIHIALLATDLLALIRPLALTPAWLALAAIACWPWGDLRLPIAVMSSIFILADGTSLALLPRMERSFGPVTPSLLALTLARTALTIVVGLLWNTVRLSPSAMLRTGAHDKAWPGLLLTTALHLGISIAATYATWIEPFRIGVTQTELRSPKLDSHTPLRMLHVSDLHVERITAREKQLLHLVEKLAPDVIVLTGDYLTLSSIHDTVAQTETYDLLAHLCDIAGPRCPVYAITGSPPVDHPDIVPDIFRELPITWLLDETKELDLNGHAIRIVGMRCTAERKRDVPRLRHLLDSAQNPYGVLHFTRNSEDVVLGLSKKLFLSSNPAQANAHTPFTLLLYHSPDLMPEAVKLGVDLYLCGHTHGGQIRLPIFGAVFTSSDFGKRYEMGRYEENGTTLYVSRGVGMEGLGAPRARFLAPPEIVMWTLSSSS